MITLLKYLVLMFRFPKTTETKNVIAGLTRNFMRILCVQKNHEKLLSNKRTIKEVVKICPLHLARGGL